MRQNCSGHRLRSERFRLENAVAVELLRRKHYFNPLLNVYYWMDRQQREVDFVVTEGVEVRELIQVCYDVSDFSTKKREVENLVKASEKLRCDNLKVITWNYEGVDEVDGKKVEFVKAWKWFLSV